MQILVIEYEPKVGHAVQEVLRVKGYDVTLASTDEEGLFLDNSRAYDLAVLDVMRLPCDGSEGVL